MLFDQSQNALPLLGRPGSTRGLTGATVYQALGPAVPKSPIHSFQLPVAQLEQLRRFDLRQLALFDPLEHAVASYLFLAHPCPFQPDLPVQFEGTFLSSY